MDIKTFSEFITQVGFPIFVAIIMMEQNRKTADNYQELYHELKETIENNSQVVSELIYELREKK